MKDYGIHDTHLLIIPMLLSFPVGSSRSRRWFFSPFKKLEEQSIDHLMNVGNALAEMWVICGRWSPQRNAADHSWLVKQLGTPKQCPSSWAPHRGVWCNFKCLKFTTDEPSDIWFRLGWGWSVFCCFPSKCWILMFLRHVDEWMQAMTPQTRHMLPSDRGRILILLRPRARDLFTSSVHELKSFGTDCSKASAFWRLL